MTKVINSPAADLPRTAKKAEGKKRKSPCTPLREKGKGKEHSRGSWQNRLSRARMRTRLGEALDRDLDIAVRAFAETAALTLADNRATERIFAALDWERERRSAKNRIDAAMRRLKKSDRDFARAVLRGKSWCEMGLAKSTFSDRLKKVEKLLSCL